MILAIDAGNTHIVLGCLDGPRTVFTARLSTDRQKTADEYALMFRSLFDLHQVDRKEVEGAIVASVVSELTENIRRAAEIVGGFMEDIFGKELRPWQDANQALVP